MNRHNAWDLAQMQSLPLEQKIIMSKQRIRQWYEHYDGEVYVSFSGGKDSTVLLHLVRSLYPDVEAVFCDTGLEYPEIKEFVRTFENVKWIRPKKSFRQVIQEYGYPVISKEISQIVREAKIGINRNDGSYKYRIQRITGTGNYAPKDGKKSRYDVSHYRYLLDAPFDISEKCCSIMKKQPSRRYAKESGKKVILGTMASESRLRHQRWIKYGCNAFDASGDNQSSNPLSFWTEQDILHYIKKYNIPYCSVYGEIVADMASDFEGQATIYDAIEDYDGIKLKTTGCNRTGCMFCMLGCHLDRNPNRFQRMKETHPQIYEYCMKPIEEGGLGLAKVLDYINVKH